MTIAVRLTLVVLGTGLYAGLAILGWAGFSAFFSNPARVAAFIVLFALAMIAFFAGGNLSPGLREDRANRWVLPVFGVIGLLAAYLPAYTDRMGFWTLDGDAIRWLGVAVFAAGGALRIWPVFVLGPRFSGLVAIQPGHTLVTHGIYGVIRHPSYLGLLISSFGWGLLFRSAAGCSPHPSAAGAYPGRREAARHAIWRGVRGLPRPHVAADSRDLLASSGKNLAASLE